MPVPAPISPSAFPDRESRSFGRRWFAVFVCPSALALVLSWALLGYWRADAPGSHRNLPRHVRYGFVLDGQSPDGFRVSSGLELLRRGVFDTLIVSGVEVGGGVHYSTLWVRMLPLLDNEKGRILEMRSSCSSTMDEARMMDSFFEGRKADSVVVVTSAFHVWRASSIFEKASDGRRNWYFHGADDSRWASGWSRREGLKSRFMEWSKRILWVLVEQWLPAPRDLGIPDHAIAGGEALGRLPPALWKP